MCRQRRCLFAGLCLVLSSLLLSSYVLVVRNQDGLLEGNEEPSSLPMVECPHRSEGEAPAIIFTYLINEGKSQIPEYLRFSLAQAVLSNPRSTVFLLSEKSHLNRFRDTLDGIAGMANHDHLSNNSMYAPGLVSLGQGPGQLYLVDIESFPRADLTLQFDKTSILPKTLNGGLWCV
jgi:hypothetical protein